MVLRDHICLFTLVLQLTTTWGSKQGSLTFVIDGTGSMKNDIFYVIDAVDQITDEVTKTSSQIENIVLVAFNDHESYNEVSDAQLMTITTGKNKLKTALKKILVGKSGGDCPEMAMTGIKLALENSHRNSHLFVFTDAPPKDSHLTKEVIKIAQAKDSKVVFVVTPGCGHYSQFKSYQDVAVATFGQVFQLKDKSDVRTILDYVKVTSGGDISPLTAESVQPSDEFTAVRFTVDHSTQHVIISATGQRHVSVKGLGELPGTFEPVIWISNIKVIKLKNLPPGKYKVMIRGHSLTTVMIFGRTDFTFQYGFSSNERTSIQNSYKLPIQGRKRHLLISINDPDRSVKISSVKILDKEQKVIKVLPLTKQGKDFYTTEMFTSPSSTFLLAVSGIEIESGKPITRIAKTPISPLIPTSRPEITILGNPCCYPYNSNISLTCKVQAFPEPNIIWRDGEGKRVINTIFDKSSPTQFQSKLVTKALKSQIFSCQAVNEAGNVISTVDVKVDPPFTIPDRLKGGVVTNISIENGQKGILYCEIQSSMPMFIKWYKKSVSGFNIQVDTSKTQVSDHGRKLTLNKMDENLQGDYSCYAYSEVDPTTYINLNYHVHIKSLAPQIELPSYVNVKEGRNTRILCKTIQGYPKPSIQWQFKSYESTTYLSKGKGEYLIVNDAEYEDAGHYKCIAENSVSHDEKTVEVTVTVIPNIILMSNVDISNVTYNSKLTLACKVRAYPEPNIIWKDGAGNVLKESEREVTKPFYEYISSISIEKIKKSEKYYCYASNSEGTFHEYADVTVKDAFIDEEKSKVVNTNFGKKATLLCNIKSSAPMQIIWTRKVGNMHEQIVTSDKFSISSDGNTLTINKMNLDLQGQYVCKASLVDDKNVNSERFIEVKITDIEPPKIEKGDDKLTVSVTKPVTIACIIVKGNPEPKVAWLFIRKGSKTIQTLAETGNKLVIKNSSLDDAGDYICNVENIAGHDKRATEVIVKASPNIVLLTGGNLSSVPYNSKLSLTCKVTAYPEPIIIWKDSKGNLLKQNTPEIKISPYEFLNTLSVDKIKKSEVYSCHATNSEGKFVGYANVTVQNPFTVVNDSEVMNVKYGREVSLLCKIRSSFPTQIIWTRKIGDKQETVWTSDKIAISSDRTLLTIKNMTLGDQGEYTCKVSLVEDKHIEAQRYIEVKISDVEPPKIEKEKSMVTVKMETPITIECKLVKGYPKPKISWQFIRKGSKVLQSLVASGERLVVKNSSLNDAGDYVCIAENVIGQDKYVVEVIVEAPPRIIVDDENVYYTAVKGDAVLRIPCKVTGYPKPTIVWMVNGTGAIRETRSIENGALLIYKPVEKSASNYTCRAENKLGIDERIFEAYVTDTIEFEQDYGNYSYVYILEGQTKPLTCPFANSPNNYIINWYKEGEYSNNNDSIWWITKADQIADGNYTCRASNRLGAKSHTFIVDVGYGPTLVSEYHQPNIDWNGENQFLNCETKAKPDANVDWTYNGKVIKPKSYYLPVRDWEWGDYTCQTSNVHGTINRSFKVTSSGCLIKRHSKIGQTPLLLTTDLEPTWPKLKTKTQYFYLKQNDQYLFSCNTKNKSPNVFRNIAKTSAVVVTCDHEDQFKVNGKILKFEDLQCESRVEPTIKATGEECLGENTELFKVGFEVNYFVEVYEVCFDQVKKVPLYTKIVKSKELSSTSVEESEWYNYAEFGKDQGTYNCTGVSTCCLTKGQLVNSHDVMYGPAHTATFVDHLNSVPLWRSCTTDKTKNWGDIEDIYREQFRYASNFTLWTGASNYTSNHGLMIPRYLWKVAKLPGEDPVVFIYVNDPFPVAEDVRCESKGACLNIRWFKSAENTYCCPFDKFLKAFDIDNFNM